MSGSPGKDIIQDIAIELGVDPSFVEKDWYAVKAITCIAAIKNPGIQPVFSGGTSLSKGYGLIQRFSEDLDFKVLSKMELARDQCRAYRDAIIEAIDSIDDFTVDRKSLIKGDKSRFFGFTSAFSIGRCFTANAKTGDAGSGCFIGNRVQGYNFFGDTIYQTTRRNIY